jgi:hypothetical protein
MAIQNETEAIMSRIVGGYKREQLATHCQERPANRQQPLARSAKADEQPAAVIEIP